MRPFETVIQEHGPSLLAFCRARVGFERGEDCFQETALAALRSYESLRDEASVKSWLFTIAERRALDIHRAAARLPVPDEDIEDLTAVSEDVHRDEAIWRSVEDLPPKQSAAILLRFRGDLNHREIGEAMDITEAAARRNVFEGLRNLRELEGSWQ